MFIYYFWVQYKYLLFLMNIFCFYRCFSSQILLFLSILSFNELFFFCNFILTWSRLLNFLILLLSGSASRGVNQNHLHISWNWVGRTSKCKQSSIITEKLDQSHLNFPQISFTRQTCISKHLFCECQKISKNRKKVLFSSIASDWEKR